MEDFWQKKSSKEFLIFAEKPATGDEKAVSAVLQKFISAYGKNDVFEISNLLSNSALVKGIATRGVFINKKDYIALLKNNLENIRLLTISDAVVRVNNGDAKVYGVMTIHSLDGQIGESDIFLKLFEKDKQWLISQIIVQDLAWSR
ncbi:MAG: hypothetical protein HYW79_02105 [Parcubacteria group bacterium]|nr:hypothetical protein [Parcubacteria group bacterium]